MACGYNITYLFALLSWPRTWHWFPTLLFSQESNPVWTGCLWSVSKSRTVFQNFGASAYIAVLWICNFCTSICCALCIFIFYRTARQWAYVFCIVQSSFLSNS